MVTQQQIDGGWTELKGKAKNTWGQLDDDELKQFEGSVDEFVGLIQRKTGEARAEIEKWVKDLDDNYRPYMQQAADTAREYVDATAEAAQQRVAEMRDQVAAGREQAEQMVKKRPTESVAVAFGAGIVAGVVVGLLTRSRS